ncbi:MAG TPA: hypothetical protein VHO06_10270 [Polyangia bacterium]|nr:hypothetical protein [Polyangia bacterium]
MLRPPARAATTALLAAALTAALAAAARANPAPLPFTYIYETLPAGDAEVELYTDLTPLHLINANATQGTYLVPQFQSEIEYGLTDHLELGLYLVLVPTDYSGFLPPPSTMEGTGVKQRLRYRFADAGQWPVDLAVYGEVVENAREIELEGKVILQRRVGPLRIAANAWGERELYFNGTREWVLNPTAGAVLERWIRVQPGVEYWMHGELADGGSWNLRPQHYLGPTVILQLGKIWWSNGFYFRLNGLQTPAAGTSDAYGAVWARTIVGISF